jgi:hypothetical protein
MSVPTPVLNNWKRFADTTRTHTGNLRRRTKTFTAEGDTVSSYSDIATGLLFSLSEGMGGLSNNESVYADRIGSRTAFVASFASGLSIELDDQIQETAPDTRLFEVVGKPNKGVSLMVATKVIVAEVL